jgi:hypothetical protein
MSIARPRPIFIADLSTDVELKRRDLVDYLTLISRKQESGATTLTDQLALNDLYTACATIYEENKKYSAMLYCYDTSILILKGIPNMDDDVKLKLAQSLRFAALAYASYRNNFKKAIALLDKAVEVYNTIEHKDADVIEYRIQALARLNQFMFQQGYYSSTAFSPH